MDELLDGIAMLFWILMFIAPLLSIIVTWKVSEQPKFMRLLIGLVVGVLISLICYGVSLSIIFRDGMGP